MDYLSLITTPIEEELRDLRKILDKSFENSSPALQKVLSYIHARNGKMMRPILVLLVSKSFHTVNYSTLNSAATIELLHTASLVHDDVVDESLERRGQASANAIYNNKVSILIGDYLLSTSLQHASHTSDIRIISKVSELGKTLASGEIIQLSAVNEQRISEEIYFEIISKKTAILFATCAEIGAISAGAPENLIDTARLFGHYLGICFQIKDDIFDYFTNADIGKPTGNDMIEGKLTLPAIHVLNSYNDKEMLAIAYNIKALKASHEEIQKLVQYVIEKGGIDYAVEVMNDYYSRAKELIDYFPNETIRPALTAYLDYVINRTK